MVPNSSPLLGYAGVVSWKLIKDSILNAISGTAQKVQSYLEWISNVPNLFIPGAKLTTRKTQETSRCCHYIPIILYRDSILIMHIIPPFLLVTSQLFMVLWPTLRFRCIGAGGACPWCCTASGNSPWSSPQSANHERSNGCQKYHEISTTPNDWSIIFLENHRFWRKIDVDPQILDPPDFGE